MFSISQLTNGYYEEIKNDLFSLPPLTVVGIVSINADDATQSYVKTLQAACERVGITLLMRSVHPDETTNVVIESNCNPEVSGIFVFYPIGGEDHDSAIRKMVLPHKDIEGLNQTWTSKLLSNDRLDNSFNKAIVPCTALAILKTLISACSLTETPKSTFVGETVTIFNRSKIVGYPLAQMLYNDGAVVFSFDVNGGYALPNPDFTISRTSALKRSSVVITGVPSKSFECIQPNEINDETVCLNFSFVENFTPEAIKKSRCYIPRVGPMTIAMCLRNAVRLHRYSISYHRHPLESF